MSGRARHAKAVLIAVIGLHLVAETALTPFLPQLFERLYGIEDHGATGLYLWVCRIVGLAVLPLWGLAARRWPLHRLVLGGLCGTAVLDLLLGLAPSYAAYTAVSTAVVATNSALLLAYPAFIAQYDGGGDGAGDAAGGDGERSRLAGICSIVVVFHLSAVAATVVGAGVLALPDPRWGISSFALLDVVLAVLVHRVMCRRAPAAADVAVPAAADTPTAQAAAQTQNQNQPRPAPKRHRRGRFALLAQVALIGLAFDFSVSVARPFFTEFAADLGGGATASAVLFFLPSVAALAVLPVVRRCHALLGDRLLPLSMAVGAAGLLWQALADSLPALVGGRLLFGVCLGLGQVAVELRMFRATGTAGPEYTAVETARSAGLLAAPLVATAAVSADLALPLAVAAAVQVLGTLLALRRARPAAPVPAPVPAVPAPRPEPAPSSSPVPEPVPALAHAKENDR
ncbi:hypothetical protein CUT44_16090 [Streptomyces carminius]|uniref:MFS transporter n=1 Tax=Streptomyces carminius TaxID=2665496 RepID=A0A2M8LY03_9ACTN|nr:hypothetical protein [Streptomyces carminius]PJE96832.1 hypothetical protein CUT44_16090 [Streptomyces carminius]